MTAPAQCRGAQFKLVFESFAPADSVTIRYQAASACPCADCRKWVANNQLLLTRRASSAARPSRMRKLFRVPAAVTLRLFFPCSVRGGDHHEPELAMLQAQAHQCPNSDDYPCYRYTVDPADAAAAAVVAEVAAEAEAAAAAATAAAATAASLHAMSMSTPSALDSAKAPLAVLPLPLPPSTTPPPPAFDLHRSAALFDPDAKVRMIVDEIADEPNELADTNERYEPSSTGEQYELYDPNSTTTTTTTSYPNSTSNARHATDTNYANSTINTINTSKSNDAHGTSHINNTGSANEPNAPGDDDAPPPYPGFMPRADNATPAPDQMPFPEPQSPLQPQHQQQPLSLQHQHQHVQTQTQTQPHPHHSPHQQPAAAEDDKRPRKTEEPMLIRTRQCRGKPHVLAVRNKTALALPLAFEATTVCSCAECQGWALTSAEVLEPFGEWIQPVSTAVALRFAFECTHCSAPHSVPVVPETWWQFDADCLHFGVSEHKDAAPQARSTCRGLAYELTVVRESGVPLVLPYTATTICGCPDCIGWSQAGQHELAGTTYRKTLVLNSPVDATFRFACSADRGQMHEVTPTHDSLSPWSAACGGCFRMELASERSMLVANVTNADYCRGKRHQLSVRAKGDIYYRAKSRCACTTCRQLVAAGFLEMSGSDYSYFTLSSAIDVRFGFDCRTKAGARHTFVLTYGDVKVYRCDYSGDDPCFDMTTVPKADKTPALTSQCRGRALKLAVTNRAGASRTFPYTGTTVCSCDECQTWTHPANLKVGAQSQVKWSLSTACEVAFDFECGTSPGFYHSITTLPDAGWAIECSPPPLHGVFGTQRPSCCRFDMVASAPIAVDICRGRPYILKMENKSSVVMQYACDIASPCGCRDCIDVRSAPATFTFNARSERKALVASCMELRFRFYCAHNPEVIHEFAPYFRADPWGWSCSESKDEPCYFVVVAPVAAAATLLPARLATILGTHSDAPTLASVPVPRAPR